MLHFKKNNLLRMLNKHETTLIINIKHIYVTLNIIFFSFDLCVNVSRFHFHFDNGRGVPHLNFSLFCFGYEIGFFNRKNVSLKLPRHEKCLQLEMWRLNLLPLCKYIDGEKWLTKWVKHFFFNYLLYTIKCSSSIL